MDQLEDSDRAVSWGWHRVLGVGGGGDAAASGEIYIGIEQLRECLCLFLWLGLGLGLCVCVCVYVCVLVGIERLRVATQQAEVCVYV